MYMSKLASMQVTEEERQVTSSKRHGTSSRKPGCHTCCFDGVLLTWIVVCGLF